MAQGLRLHASSPGSTSWILGWGTKILHVRGSGQKINIRTDAKKFMMSKKKTNNNKKKGSCSLSQSCCQPSREEA